MSRKTNTQRITEVENALNRIESALLQLIPAAQAPAVQTPAIPMAAPAPAPVVPINVPQQLLADIPGKPFPQPPERLGDCACCGQRLRIGTIDLRTGEYIPSGFTTQWLAHQNGITVLMGQQAYTVSGEWLITELKKRTIDPNTGQRGRAISIPGFLCGEGSSTHATIKLAQPILRRATTSEEQAKYRERVLAEARRIQ